MEDPWQAALIEIARYVSLGLSALALLIIVFATVEAGLGIARDLLGGHPAATIGTPLAPLRALACLRADVQLAADVVPTSIAPTWDEIGRVAAIAAIRAFLKFFLDRDIDAVSQRERDRRSRDDDARRA